MDSSAASPVEPAADLGALAPLLDRAAILRAIAGKVRATTGADLGYVGQCEGDRPAVVLSSWAGTRTSALYNLVIPSGRGLGGKALALVRPIWVADYCRSTEITHDFDDRIRAEGIGAQLAVPMVHQDRTYGIAYAALRQRCPFGDAAIAAVQSIAQEGAAALALADRAAENAAIAVGSERHRVAVSLHDSVGATLFSIGAEIRSLRAARPAPDDLLPRLADLEAQVARAASELRQSLAALEQFPPDRRLAITVEGDCAAFTTRTGVSARAIPLGELPALEPFRHDALVAAVREALLNIAKHAQATQVLVTMTTEDDGVSVAVADDGIGWPAAGEPREPNGMGLAAAAERLARLGGRLRVFCNEDNGLTVRAWVPCR